MPEIFPESKALAGNLKENTPGLGRYILAPWRLFYHSIVLRRIISPRLQLMIFIGYEVILTATPTNKSLQSTIERDILSRDLSLETVLVKISWLLVN